jgi:hypothetical protein
LLRELRICHELVAAQESRVVRDRNDPILVISWIPHHVR